jgi:CelD/BcsL family acetyltransferase involved in cellulose biosynthesis
MSTRDEFEGISIDGWERLAADHGVLATQDPAWVCSCFEAFPDPANLLTVGGAAAPDAIAPLVRGDHFLELAGVQGAREPCDLLYRSRDALGALLDQLVRSRRPLALRRIPADSETIAAAREVIGRRGYVRVADAPAHPVIELHDRWSEPGGGMSSSRRSALRRARRRAEQKGDVTFDLLRPTVEEVPRLLDEAIAVEARSWKGEQDTAIASKPSWNVLFRRLGERAAAQDRLLVQFMRIDGHAVAMQLCTEWKQCIWVFKIGYDAEYSKASPGQVLLAESVADAARRGLERYQLLGEGEGWITAWTEEFNPCVSLLALPPSRASAAAIVGKAVSTVRRRIAAR